MGLTAVALDRFAIDQAMPGRVVTASTTEDVVAAIRDANAARESVILWGGGTRMSIGDAPARYDVALDLAGLRGVVAHEPGDLTVTVRAGTTVAELAEALEPHGQRWPVEVAHPYRATVGGTIASAAGGPSRLRWGHPRDRAIGCRAVLGDGTVARSGGQVVKNVTGYDLTRLYSGSYGTLAALVEISLKLVPVADRTLTLRADLPDPAFGYRATRTLLAERLPIDALAMLMGDVGEDLAPSWTALYVRLEGTAGAVERMQAAVTRHLPVQEVDGEVWQRIAALPANAPLSLRAAWPASRAFEVYPQRAVWYPGVEVMHLLDDKIDAEHARILRAGLEGSGGALILERAPDELRREVGTWGTPRLPLAIAQRLRSAFDPNGVLSPGRMP